MDLNIPEASSSPKFDFSELPPNLGLSSPRIISTCTESSCAMVR